MKTQQRLLVGKTYTIFALVLLFPLTAEAGSMSEVGAQPQAAALHSNWLAEGDQILRGIERSFRIPHSRPAQLVFTDSLLPNAFSSPSGKITLSQGLLKVIEDRSELAFVIAHEYAHLALGHVHGLERGTPPIMEFLALEQAADRLALELVRINGYQPLAAIHLLERIKTVVGSAYPSIGPRLAALKGSV